MKRHILRDPKIYPSQVFALLSPKPFAQIAWTLVEHLHIPLEREPDLELTTDQNTHYWPRYSYTDPESESTFILVRNKGTDSYLVPELKNVDIFLVEINQYLTFQLSLDNISKTSFVNFCFEVETNMIKPESQQLLHA
ncbi:MAG: IPExxxVDY family protein [Bacteroidia bacterium]|nr:IPExxxVDY family protein [Bacteroidia bacterium]